jgi:hypothetical protein
MPQRTATTSYRRGDGELLVLEAIDALEPAASVDIEHEAREAMLRRGLPGEKAQPIVFGLIRSYSAGESPLVESDAVRLYQLTGRRRLERLRPARRAS